MKTIERQVTETGSRVAFQPKDIQAQVVISALAAAPGGESIVYVRRTVVQRIVDWFTKHLGSATSS